MAASPLIGTPSRNQRYLYFPSAGATFAVRRDPTAGVPVIVTDCTAAAALAAVEDPVNAESTSAAPDSIVSRPRAILPRPGW